MNSHEGGSSDPGVPSIPGPYVPPEQTESLPLKQSLHGGNRKLSKECCPCMRSEEGSGLRVIVMCFFILSLIITVGLAAQIYFGDYQLVPHGSVATDSHLCSVIGTDILKDGGNAVDAAVASTFCMGVVNPHVTGLGGGGFLLVYDHQKKKVLDAIDFRETAPLGFSGSLINKDIANGVSIGVPGLVRGLGLAHKLHGKMKWKDVVMPSVLLAKRGFDVPESLVWAWKGVASSAINSSLEATFSHLEAGENLALPSLAGALERIAVLGPDEFYNGSLADSIVQAARKYGGIITRQDLENFQPKSRDAEQTTFFNFDVFVPGTPSGGPFLLSVLDSLRNSNITLDSEDIMGEVAGNLADTYENYKGFWGDPAFPDSQNGSGTAWDFPEAVASHVAAVDLNDLYVSVLSGLNTWFGSQIMTNEFILNNALRNFDIGNNTAAPLKKPLSLAVPVIVTQSGEVCGRRLVLGAADASVAVQLLTELLLLNKNGTSSIEASRFHFIPSAKQLGFEDGTEPDLSKGALNVLKKMGYQTQILQKPYQSSNIVEKIGDTLISHSDSRGGGLSSRF